MIHAVVLLLSLVFPAAQEKAPTTVTGKWTMTVEMEAQTATPALELVQAGEKITGNYVSARYGKFQLAGTIKGRALQFTVTLNVEGTEVPMKFQGEVAADFQSIKGEADMSGAGAATWTAKRDKAKQD